MDINNVPDIDEYPLSYPVSTAPASLKNLAATTLALDLWHHKGLNRPTFRSFSCTELLSDPLPLCLRELVDKRIISLGLQLKTVCSSFIRSGILRNDGDFFRRFDSLTYATEDEIYPEKSAVKFLRNDELTDLEKFKIASVYWLENDIRRVWPSVSDLPELTSFANSDTFMQYHVIVQRMRHTIAVFFPDTVIQHMREIIERGNWAALVGMVNTLRRQEQSNVLSYFIKSYSPIKYLLPKLNRAQVDDILRNIPDEIISKLASQKECFAFVMKIWNLAKESISAECFVKLLNYLCYGGYVCDERARCHEEAAQVRLVLSEIWNTAPSRVKREIIENNVRGLLAFAWRSGFDSRQFQVGCNHERSMYRQLPKFFKEGLKNSWYYPICFDHEMDFFFKLFEEMPSEMRAAIWRIQWRGIVIRSRSEVFNRFLCLCLENENDIRSFVEEKVLNFEQIECIVDLWIRKKLYDEVIGYSNLCTWNLQLVQDFRRRVFLKIVPSMGDVSCDKLIELAAEIDRKLSNAEIAKDAKRTTFLSDDAKKFFISQLRKGSTKEAISVIDCFLRTERNQCEKQLLLDLWCDFLIDGQDNEFDGRWEEFLSWWEGYGEDWPIFKQFLNVDEISIKLMLEAVPKLGSWLDLMEIDDSEISLSKEEELDEFSHVDNFLMWYFGSEERVRSYKLEKITNYRKTPGLRNIFRMYNDVVIDKVLEWFFNGDLEEFCKFESDFEIIRN